MLDEMAPAGSRISIERDLFPELVGHGLYGYEGSGYWLDIGTPDRYLQGTFDILEGDVQTEIGQRVLKPVACSAKARCRAGSTPPACSAPTA